MYVVVYVRGGVVVVGGRFGVGDVYYCVVVL